MANTVELQATDLFQELDDAELSAVVGGANLDLALLNLLDLSTKPRSMPSLVEIFDIDAQGVEIIPNIGLRFSMS